MAFDQKILVDTFVSWKSNTPLNTKHATGSTSLDEFYMSKDVYNIDETLVSNNNISADLINVIRQDVAKEYSTPLYISHSFCFNCCTDLVVVFLELYVSLCIKRGAYSKSSEGNESK